MTIRELVSTGMPRGTLALELAMIAPVFVVVALGVIEVGRGVMVNNIVANAAQEGARTAIINGSTNADVASSVQTFVNSNLGISASDVTVEIATSPAPGNPDPVNNIANCQKGDQVHVRVQIPYGRVSLIGGTYLKGKTLTGLSSMYHE